MNPVAQRDPALFAPLAALQAAQPTAPGWFMRALALQPERAELQVQGTAIETLSWGTRGKPGLLLLHGNRAHADWWSFIAPFFADDWRVTALSFSGTGASGWRPHYSMEIFAQEAAAVAQATGLFESNVKPVVVAHSLGGVPAMLWGSQQGQRLRGVVIVDTPVMTPQIRAARDAARSVAGVASPDSVRPNRVYASMAEALARFRFMPLQLCENLFVADHIARGSLKQVHAEDGSAGFTWRFDPFQWETLRVGDPASSMRTMLCPLAMIHAERSAAVTPEVLAYMKTLAPPGTPFIELTAARHHVMVDEPLALVAALRALLAAWPTPHQGDRR